MIDAVPFLLIFVVLMFGLMVGVGKIIERRARRFAAAAVVDEEHGVKS